MSDAAATSPKGAAASDSGAAAQPASGSSANEGSRHVPPLSPKLHNSLSGIALSNLARNFSIGTPPHTPSSAVPTGGSALGGGERARGDSGPSDLALSPSVVMTTGTIAATGLPSSPSQASFSNLPGAHTGVSGGSSLRRAEFSQSGSTLAPLGAPARRVDTDDELLQQQVLWEVDLSELDFTGSKVLGRGAYGEVIQAKWRSLPVAIKR